MSATFAGLRQKEERVSAAMQANTVLKRKAEAQNNANAPQAHHRGEVLLTGIWLIGEAQPQTKGSNLRNDRSRQETGPTQGGQRRNQRAGVHGANEPSPQV